MDGEAWRATVRGVAELDMIEAAEHTAQGSLHVKMACSKVPCILQTMHMCV